MLRLALIARSAVLLALSVVLISPAASAGNLMNEEQDIYVVRPILTEAPWVQTGAYFKSFLFDMPNAVSRPTPQVGFQFTPGFTWSVLNLLELNVGFPMVLNPDETGDRELDAADRNPSLKDRDNWDSHPDFDLPGLLVGLKGRILGNKAEDRFFLGVGMYANLPIFESWATNFTQWKTDPFEKSPFVISPYVTLAYTTGRFSPALQLGVNLRWSQLVDPETGNYPTGSAETVQRSDFFFNLALPFAFPFEGTAPMIEVNGVFNIDDQTAQIFITPAVTFLPKGSPASLGFACMLPILDSGFRRDEGFRFLVNFSYRIDALAIPGGDEEEESGSVTDESPPEY